MPKLQQLQWTEQGTKEDHIKDGGMRLKRFKYNGNKKIKIGQAMAQ
jgi:hypothetical protein